MLDIATHLIADVDVPSPDNMGESFDALAKVGVLTEAMAMQMRKAVGFRNIAVHNYKEIDWAIVHIIARHHLDDFTGYAKAVVSHIGK